MKRIFALALICTASTLQSQAQANSGDFIVSGTVKGLRDSTMIYLSHLGQPTDVLATAYSKKGKFVLFGKVNDGDVYQLTFTGSNGGKELFLTPGKIEVTGDAAALNKLLVRGGSAQQDYEQYNKAFDGLKQLLGRLAGSINQTSPGPQRDSLINQFEVGRQQVFDQVDLFVKNKPASVVTPFVVYVTSPMSNDPEGLERRYNAMSPAVRETFYGKEIGKSLMSAKVGMEGSQAVDFTQNDTADVPVSLSSFKGRYVLVDFWASWCGPCRAENPNVVNAYNAYKDKNFTILGVSLDQSKDKWINAIKNDNLTWTHVSDLKGWGNASAQLYRIQSIPANMLIDPSGKIVGKNLRGEALEEALKRLLK